MGQGAEFDEVSPWFHGSPDELTELRAGSTITQDQALARVFSHKPSLVSADDRVGLRHNGRRVGALYRIAEAVRPEDLAPVPGSTLGPEQEWLTTRPLLLVLVERTAPVPGEQLSAPEEEALRQGLRKAP
jgi:hypothetical protein